MRNEGASLFRFNFISGVQSEAARWKDLFVASATGLGYWEERSFIVPLEYLRYFVSPLQCLSVSESQWLRVYEACGLRFGGADASPAAGPCGFAIMRPVASGLVRPSSNRFIENKVICTRSLFVHVNFTKNLVKRTEPRSMITMQTSGLHLMKNESCSIRGRLESMLLIQSINMPKTAQVCR